MDDNHSHKCCGASFATPSVHQTLIEMDFEKGIWKAALDGDEQRIKYLLDKGVDVDVRDSAGYTALHYASRQGKCETVRLLLANNADPNAKTRAGEVTPLHRAAHQGHIQTVILLIRNGAKVDACDIDGKTVLHKAAQNCQFDVCDYLVAQHPTLKDAVDKKGQRPRDLTEDVRLKHLLT